MAEKRYDQDELRARLTPEQYRVTQEGGTEPAFSGCFVGEKRTGTFACVVCAAPLFESDAKFESGSGWPSFWRPIDEARIDEVDDSSHGMRRTELRCHDCGAHLGHVFPDGPPPTGLRYCINSASLAFSPRQG